MSRTFSLEGKKAQYAGQQEDDYDDNASDSEDDEDSMFNTAWSSGGFAGPCENQRWSVLACVGLAAVSVLLASTLSSNFDGLTVLTIQETRPSWNESHVEATCSGVEGAVARRLQEEDGEEDGEDLALRFLKEKAIFDPKFLYHFKIDDHYLPYYGSSDLESDVPNDAQIAVLTFHGAMRNAQDYFCSFKNILEHSLVDKKKCLLIAPKYHYEVDMPGTNELWWNGSAPWGDWRGGAASDERSGAVVSSFEVLDRIIFRLNDVGRFPKLEKILLVGHSAGGQTVQRYALVTQVRPPMLAEHAGPLEALRGDLKIRYVVANPSSYAYLDEMRWIYDWNGSGFSQPIYAKYRADLGRSGWKADRRRRRNWPKSPTGGFAWGTYSLEDASIKTPFLCSDANFNNWHYGLNATNVKHGNLNAYLRNYPDLNRALEYYRFRDVVYMVGQNDTCTDDMLPDGVCLESCWMRDIVGGRYNQACYRNRMDIRCPAMLQGPTRNQRGYNFIRHLRNYYGEDVHRLLEIPNVGHEGENMFMSPLAQEAMFGSRRNLPVWHSAEKGGAYRATRF